MPRFSIYLMQPIVDGSIGELGLRLRLVYLGFSKAAPSAKLSHPRLAYIASAYLCRTWTCRAHIRDRLLILFLTVSEKKVSVAINLHLVRLQLIGALSPSRTLL